MSGTQKMVVLTAMWIAVGVSFYFINIMGLFAVLFAAIAGEKFKGLLHKGEQVYYELVGYTPSGKDIQKGYDYGCEPHKVGGEGEFKLYIYRITQTNVDGVVTELPWHQVKHRSKELGFDTVPEIYYGYAGKQFRHSYKKVENWRDFYLKSLSDAYVYDQDSQFCMNKVPEEGIVVRVEKGDGIENFKLKAFAFLKHESKMLDKGEADIESVESAE